MKTKVLDILLTAIIVALITLWLMAHQYADDYKRGQIDALTGHVHYRLVTMPDSSKEWREVK